jgi:hypothetical protein
MGLQRDFLQQWLEDGPTVRLIGIGQASTFPGFCGEHDARLFRSIDAADFDLNEEAIFLLAYRSLARELVARRRELLAKQEAMEMPPPEELLASLERIRFASTRLEVLGWRDLEVAKLAFDAALLHNEFRRVRWAAWKTNAVPEVLACSYVCPDADFEFHQLQDVHSEAPAFFVAASILRYKLGGVLHLAWLDDGRASSLGLQLVRSLARAAKNLECNAFLIWLLLVSESAYWSKSWWDALGPASRGSIGRMAKAPARPEDVELLTCSITDRLGMARHRRKWPPPFR